MAKTARARDIERYFSLHRGGRRFNVLDLSDDEVAIAISREDFERYIQNKGSSCYYCGESPRPYTKGEFITIEGGNVAHKKCHSEMVH